MSDVSITPFQRHFLRIGAELDVCVSFNKVVEVASDKRIVAPIFMPHFGSPAGILIFETADSFWPWQSMLVSQSFAYSTLGPSSDDDVDIESTKDMLEEWGWSGPADQKPTWFVEAES